MNYETEAIRELLAAAFNDTELTTLCFDHFRYVHSHFGDGMGLRVKIQELLDYCTRHEELDRLLDLVTKKNPGQYSNFEPLLHPYHKGKTDLIITLPIDLFSIPSELQSAAISAAVGALAGALGIPLDQMATRKAQTGSLVLHTEMPIETAARLIALYQTDNPLILELGIQHVEVVHDEMEALEQAQIQDLELDSEREITDFEPEMILIPAGEFLMGSNFKKDKDAYDDEQPQHTLHLPDYYLAKTPVTNAQYLAFVQATNYELPKHWKGGRPPSDKEDHPVVYVSWHDATAYCNWLAEVTGKPYRLPSEAEWEKAARGDDGRIYPWGDQWDATRCNSRESGKGDTTPVGTCPEGASPYGLLDMAGNVWEWTSSLYKSYPCQANDGREDPGASGSRVLRGGSWYGSRGGVRSAYRDGYPPRYRSGTLGFRCGVAATP